jgi:DNA-binding FadR family transcriptional regulator
VVQDIAGKIDSGVWPDGHQLPPERILAEQYGLARNTVRSALRQLEERGHVVRQVGRGTFVRPSTSRRRGSELVGRMREASPAALMEVRLIMEPPAALLAATRAGAEDLAQLDHALRQSISARGTAEFEHWDAELHLAIFRAARNELLVDYCVAINAVRNQPRWYRLKQKTLGPDLRYVYDQQHTRIVTALKDRDGEAARRALREHLETVRSNLLGALG